MAGLPYIAGLGGGGLAISLLCGRVGYGAGSGGARSGSGCQGSGGMARLLPLVYVCYGMGRGEVLKVC